jgi:hypothetical protein
VELYARIQIDSKKKKKKTQPHPRLPPLAIALTHCPKLMPSFSFASINMQWRNAAMHALLATNIKDDILFIQEPWFSTVGTTRCNSALNGKDVLGGVASPKWTLAYPFFSAHQRAKVMTYVRLHNRSSPFRKSFVKHIVQNDLCAHPCILIVDIVMTDTYWCTINFYNDVDDPSVLTALMALDLDATIPTRLTGDFNLHSHTWSPLDWMHSHATD